MITFGYGGAGSLNERIPNDPLHILLYDRNYFGDPWDTEEVVFDPYLLEQFETALIAANVHPTFVRGTELDFDQNPQKEPVLLIVYVPVDSFQDFFLTPLSTSDFLPSPFLETSYTQPSGVRIKSDNPRTMDTAVNYGVGMALYTLGRCEEANTYFEPMFRAKNQLRDDPLFPTAITFYLANCMIAQNNLSRAVELFGSIAPCCPEYLWYYFAIVPNLSWTYLRLGRNTEAFHAFDLFFNPNPPDPDLTVWALVKRSQLYTLAFRYDEAIADMDAAISLDPNNPLLFVERGQRIMLLYEWDRALEDYNHALDINPNYADAYYYRGILYASIPADERRAALADFQRYLDLAPEGQHAIDAARYLADIQAQLDVLDAGT